MSTSSYSYAKLAGGDEDDEAPPPVTAAPHSPSPVQQPQSEVPGIASAQAPMYGQPPGQPQHGTQPQPQWQPATQLQWQPTVVTATEVPAYAFPQVPQPGAALAGSGGVNGWSLPALMQPRNFRAWRGGLFTLSGDGSSRDWSICCIGLWFPYILFGQNMNRALGLKYASQSMYYFLCVFFFRWVVNFCAHLKCGYEPRFVLQSPHHTLLISGRKMLQSGWSSSSNELTSSEMLLEEEAEYDIEQWALCMYPYTITLSFAWIVMLVFFGYAGYRRIQIRQKFGIPGDDTLDYVAWMFCAPCALCQETRTMSYNNVEGGEWIGPSREAFLAQGFPQGAYAMQAPAPYGLQLHPLNENGALGVPVGTPMMGTPVQQPPPQRGVPEQPAMNPVMGFAAAPQQHS